MPPEILNEEAPDQVEQAPVTDRRAMLEAAFEKSSDEPAPEPEAKAEPDAKVEPEVKGEPEAKPEPEAKSEDETPADTKTYAVDKPPQSWRPAQKAKWETLDSDVRQEVIRRDREVTRVLNETAQARQFTQQFGQAVQPFLARIQAQGAHPLQAVQNLLAADHALSTSSKGKRAELMAKLIKDYDVDVGELDAVLAGQPRQSPQHSDIEQLLGQRLAPFEQFLQQQQRAQQQAAAAEQAKLEAAIEDMSNNPKEYPYFDQVRETMADLIDLAAKKGQPLSLKECYNKATAMDPRVSAELAAKAEEAMKAKLVAERNSRAQRAKQASSSVSGAPSGIRAGAPAGDRRALIEAAFEAAAGR